MKKFVASLVIALAFGPGWLAAASALFCLGTGKMALFVFPYDQWLQAAPWWRLNWMMTVSVVGSAALPTLFALSVCYGVVRRGYVKRRQPIIYGSSDWANREEMQRGGVKLDRRPF